MQVGNLLVNYKLIVQISERIEYRNKIRNFLREYLSQLFIVVAGGMNIFQTSVFRL